MRGLFSLVLIPSAFLLFGATNGEKPRLTFEGLGPVRIGMTETQLEKMGFSDPYRSADWQTDEEYESCHYLSNESKYPGVGFMINDGQLVRIGIGTNDKKIEWKTLSGATLGMRETEVAAIYGSWMKMDYHPYMGDSGSYLILASRGGKYRMIFETALSDDSGTENSSAPQNGPNPEKRVTDIRAGLSGPVGFIEGCS